MEVYRLEDRNLALEAVRVTERAAIASAAWMGRGDERSADQAAVDAMRQALNVLGIDGTVVIGEGERDEAPMLYIGERVGSARDDGPAIVRNNPKARSTSIETPPRPMRIALPRLPRPVPGRTRLWAIVSPRRRPKALRSGCGTALALQSARRPIMLLLIAALIGSMLLTTPASSQAGSAAEDINFQAERILAVLGDPQLRLAGRERARRQWR